MFKLFLDHSFKTYNNLEISCNMCVSPLCACAWLDKNVLASAGEFRVTTRRHLG